MQPEPVDAVRVDPLDVAENQLAVFVENDLPEKPDELLLLRDRVAAIKQRATELLKQIDAEGMTPYVKAKGAIEVGPGVRWVLKLDKTVKCKNLRGALEALFIATGGDWEAFVQCLSVNALKPGESRNQLADRFDEFFETVVKEDVELKQPKRTLALINENFLK